jgi:integrase
LDKATEEWLNSYGRSSKATYKTLWHYFVEFVGLTGDQILENRKADKEYSWEKKVIEFKNWMINTKGQSEHSAKSATMTVRSFFSYHRLSLKFRRSESTRLMEATPKFIDYRFSRDDLKKMSDVADLQEKYVIVAGKSFGLRAGDFLKLTRGDLEAYLDRPVPISIGKYSTQKESAPAYPFIDSDAFPVIKLMIEKMDREGRVNPTDRLLTFSSPVQLTRVIKRIVEKAGIKTGSKRVRFHCLRKFLIDRLSSLMSESKWKQIVGKKISEGAYVSPDSLRDDYERAMKETCFSKIVDESDMEKIAKKQILLNVLKTMGITEKEATSMFSRRKTFKPRNIDEEIELIEQIIKEKRREEENSNNNENDCPDGEHCERFEQIPEANLLEYLRQGWQIVKETNNGKEVIVKKQ